MNDGTGDRPDDVRRPVMDSLPKFTAERGTITATGGMCAPLAPHYDLFGLSTTPRTITPLTRRQRVAIRVRRRAAEARMRVGRRVGEKIAGGRLYDDDGDDW